MKIRLLAKAKKWFRRKEDILIHILGLVLWLIILGVSLFLYFRSLMGLVTLIELVVVFLVALLGFYFYLAKKREQTILISLTSEYLLGRDESNIDELLGILIAGRWEKLKIDPIERFFRCLREICLKGQFEMKRRVAEALPALFKMDLEESKELVEILRCDWDSNRWGSDNRRRTIEALTNIIKKDKKFVKHNLNIVDKDEVFTIIAIVEVLNVWRGKINATEAEVLFADLKREMEGRRYKEDEIYAICQLWHLLDLMRLDTKEAVKTLEEMKNNQNIYLQICVARNFRNLCKEFPHCTSKNLCKGFPERMLEFTQFFLQKDKRKNVRRPIAKEDSLECLITLLRHGTYSAKAKEAILQLITDEDEIIRLTTFDRMEKILDIDLTFGKEILQVVRKDNNPKLAERAITLEKRLIG